MPTDLEPGPLGPALDEAIYEDPSAIKAALQAHAKENGYAVSYNSSVSTRVVYVCSKHGSHNDRNQGNVHESKRRKGAGTTKTGCKFRVVRKPIVGSAPTRWQVTVLNNEHNHDAVLLLVALPHHRVLIEEEHARVCSMNIPDHSPSAILTALRLANPELLLVTYDVYNLLYKMRVEESAGNTPVE